MKNAYLLEFQDYLETLDLKFTILYYSNNTLKLDVENEDGDIRTIYEGNTDNTSAHILDVQIQDFICDHIQNILLSYDDVNITRFYTPGSGFVIAGREFNIEDYKGNYNAFLKDILHWLAH